MHQSFTWFLSLNRRKYIFYRSRVPDIISKLRVDGVLWRHRHMGQPLAIVTSQWPIVPTGIYRRMMLRSARVKVIAIPAVSSSFSDPRVSTRGIASVSKRGPWLLTRLSYMTNHVLLIFGWALKFDMYGILCINTAIDVTWLAFPHYFEDWDLCSQLLFRYTCGVI